MHFAQRVRALVVLNIASVRTVERHTQTVVCFICGAKGDARHCAIFYG